MSFAHVQRIAIDPTKVGGTDHTDLTIRVRGTDPNYATIGNGGWLSHAQGYDKAYYLIYAGGALSTQLDHEQIRYNAATGEFIDAVRLPSVSHTVATEFYLATGDATITTSQENVSGSWSLNDTGVYHFENGVTLSLADSLGGTSLTNSGGVSAGTGILGGAAVFDGASSLTRATVPGISYGNAWTLTLWAKLNETPSLQNMWDMEAFPGLYGICYWWSGGANGDGVLFERINSDASGATELSAAVDLSQWHRWTFSWDGVSSRGRIRVDGVDLSAPGTASLSANLNNIFGLSYGFGGSFQSQQSVDELRFVVGEMSDARDTAEYNNEFDPGSFYSISADLVGGAGAVLEAALSGGATLTAELTTGSALAASLAGAASLTADLTTDIALAASLGSTASLTASLTTAIPLAASLSSSATLAASLDLVGAALAATLESASSISASLTTSIDLAVSLVATASLSAGLTTTSPIAADLASESTLTAELSTAIRMAAQLAGAASLTAALTTQISLAAALAATVSLVATLSVVHATITVVGDARDLTPRVVVWDLTPDLRAAHVDAAVSVSDRTPSTLVTEVR